MAKMRDGLIQRGKGRWTACLNLGLSDPDPVTGRRKPVQRWVSLGRCSRQEAKKKREDLMVAARKGELVEPTKLTVREWLATWMDEAVKPSRRPNTVRVYGLAIDKHIGPALGAVPLQALRAGHIQKYHGEKRTDLADATLGVHHAILTSALKPALRQGLVTKNVATLVDGRPRVRNDREQAKEHCWSAVEAAAFLRAAKNAGPQPAALFGLALDSGARRGELLGLRWSDVDFDAATILIDRTLIDSGREPVFGPTKNGEPRTINVGTLTLDLLRAHKARQAECKMKNRTAYRDFGLVFCRGWEDVQARHQYLGEPLGENAIARMLDQIASAAQVRRIKVHGLRHTSATLLLAAGEPVHVVAARLGHRDATVTLATYAHALPAHQQQAAQTLGMILHG